MSKTPKRILFTSHTANFQKFNRPYMRMLRGTLEAPYEDLNIGGWKVDYASANEEEIFDADNAFKVNFARSPLAFHNHIKAYKQLKKILNNNHYDLIHTHTPVGSIITRLAARKARADGTKVIYTSHGFHFYKGAPLKNWLLYFPIEKHCAKFTDLIITINHEDYERAKKSFRTKVKEINGVGVDVSKLKRSTSDKKKQEIRKKLGLSSNDFVICYTAEFTANKNHRFILNSLAPLLRQHKDIKLLFLGKGRLLEATKTLAKELSIEKQVIFPGYVEKVYDVLGACNLAISASLREGLGLGVIEAQLCSLPIIVSDNRGHRVIVGNYTKNLYDPKDEDAFRKKVESAFSGEDYYIEFNEKFSLHSSLKKMRDIYLSF